MKDNTLATYYKQRGKWFQLPMIFVWFWVAVWLPEVTIHGFDWTAINTDVSNTNSWERSFNFGGLILMAFSMYQIYTPKQPGSRQLVTSNVFALTRHPMYHGMVIAAANSFFVSDLNQPIFWLSWVVFMTLILIAGWFQEKETLARWGKEAEVYYYNTPRFIFEWPAQWLYRQQ